MPENWVGILVLVWEMFHTLQKVSKGYVSNEKIPGCSVYIGGYTTQLYRDYNKPL